MQILIVDDEAPARERLKRMLAEIPTVEILAEADNGLEALELMEELDPDLVLLDIQMPGLDGFGVIEALDDPPPIVFVTAYDEYALRAFEVNAIDYLLKPFSKDRLMEALRRAQEPLHRDSGSADRYTLLLESLGAQGNYLTRLAIRHQDRILVLPVEDIEWIGIQGRCVQVHAQGQAYPIRRTLEELEARLDPTVFFRAHRSAIVNLSQVVEIIPWFKGSHKLRLATGQDVDLSRAQARALRKRLRW